MLRNKQYYKVCRRGWHLHTDTNTYAHTYIYGMVQLQGNEYARVTREKLTCILRVHARVLACSGVERIKISARCQLLTM